ncbi:MAG: hypothetical protein HY830_26735 [Actinobacteria bacterium]|nr:hypothetical protein [Actinomycetota bacterium]
MATGSAVDTMVTLEGTGQPYALDTFSGAITPITTFVRRGGTVTVRVSLARDASTVIALSDAPRPFAAARPGNSVVSTTADSSALVGGSLVVRAAAAGTYQTTLSSGSRVRSVIGSVPAVLDLTGQAWQLDAEDWTPTNPYGTVGAAGSETTKVPVSVALTSLKAWPDIPELANASGVGTYTTTVTLPASWDATHGATLDLGRVTDTFTLAVNGQTVAVDQISAQADVGNLLHAGSNTIVVRVATTLGNRLFALDAAVRNRGVVQEYGLVGPVVLTPYRQAVVWRAR